MFNNVGGKLQILAWITCILGIVGSIIGGILCIVYGNSMLKDNPYDSEAAKTLIAEGIVLLIAGPLASWLSSLSTYALGQVAESCEKQEHYLRFLTTQRSNGQSSAPTKLKPAAFPTAVAHKPTSANNIKCTNCNEEHSAQERICPYCGYKN